MMRRPTSRDVATTKRKRGRPSGKNRVPLSLEERRARNAQYERERRNEKSEALAQLAEAAGCEPSIPATDLLATVISQIQRAASRKSSEDIENLRRINENLMSQIDKLENQLLEHCPDFDPSSLDELSQQSEESSDSVQQPTNINESRKRSHSKKNVGKRKRKNHQRKESDSQDSNDFQSESDAEKCQAKRIKSELDAHDTHHVSVNQRETRSSHSSLTSCEIARDGMVDNCVPTMYQTASDEPSNLSYQTSPEETKREECTLGAPLWTEPNMIVQLPAQLPVMYVEDVRNTEYFVTDPTVHETYTEYSTDLAYGSVIPVQEPIIETQNENPIQLGLEPHANFDLFLEQGDDLTNDCDWFDSTYYLDSHDNVANNLVYS